MSESPASWMETTPTLCSLLTAMPDGLTRPALTELDVVAVEVQHLGAAEDGVVFKVGPSDGGSVVGDDQQLAGALSERLLGGLETCTVNATLVTYQP